MYFSATKRGSRDEVKTSVSNMVSAIMPSVSSSTPSTSSSSTTSSEEDQHKESGQSTSGVTRRGATNIKQIFNRTSGGVSDQITKSRINHSGGYGLDMSVYGEHLKPVYRDGDVVLDVECGRNQGLLYLSRLCQGSKGPCILFNGMWLTPNEFQYVSGRETAKDWKRSIRHHGKSMKLLLAKGILAVHPPICDCDGCRISSPVNRERLAEKRTPTSILFNNGHQSSMDLVDGHQQRHPEYCIQNKDEFTSSRTNQNNVTDVNCSNGRSQFESLELEPKVPTAVIRRTMDSSNLNGNNISSNTNNESKTSIELQSSNSEVEKKRESSRLTSIIDQLRINKSKSLIKIKNSTNNNEHQQQRDDQNQYKIISSDFQPTNINREPSIKENDSEDLKVDELESATPDIKETTDTIDPNNDTNKVLDLQWSPITINHRADIKHHNKRHRRSTTTNGELTNINHNLHHHQPEEQDSSSVLRLNPPPSNLFCNSNKVNKLNNNRDRRHHHHHHHHLDRHHVILTAPPTIIKERRQPATIPTRNPLTNLTVPDYQTNTNDDKKPQLLKRPNLSIETDIIARSRRSQVDVISSVMPADTLLVTTIDPTKIKSERLSPTPTPSTPTTATTTTTAAATTTTTILTEHQHQFQQSHHHAHAMHSRLLLHAAAAAAAASLPASSSSSSSSFVIANTGNSPQQLTPPPPAASPSPASGSSGTGTPILKQMEQMMTRNYSDFMRSLAAKYNNSNPSDGYSYSNTNGFMRNFDGRFPFKTGTPPLPTTMATLGGNKDDRNSDSHSAPPVLGDPLRAGSVMDLSSTQALINMMRSASAHSASQLENYLRGSGSGITNLKRPLGPLNIACNAADPLDLTIQSTGHKRSRQCGNDSSVTYDLGLRLQGGGVGGKPSSFRELFGGSFGKSDSEGSDMSCDATSSPKSTNSNGGRQWTLTPTRTISPLKTSTSTAASPNNNNNNNRNDQSIVLQSKPSTMCLSTCSTDGRNCGASDQKDQAVIARWNVDDVCKFVATIDTCSEYVETFREQSIDGTALPLLTEEHLISNMQMKLGPALKLRATLAKLIGHCAVCMHCIHCHGTAVGGSGTGNGSISTRSSADSS